MAKFNSVLGGKTRLQTAFLTGLLILLPLMYLLYIHVHVARFGRVTRDTWDSHRQDGHGHRELVIQPHHYGNVTNRTSKLQPPATSELVIQPHHYGNVTNCTSKLEPPATSELVIQPHHYGNVTNRRSKLLEPPATRLNQKTECKSRICHEYLSKTDMGYFAFCWRKTNLTSEPNRSICRFLNATGRPPITLASFSGSGNTWVRGLLQLATGVCTGGIYCDTKLRISGYPGESLRSGKTLVVKTHQPDPRWTGVYYPPNTTDSYFTKESDIPVYDSAILLVRNPFHALVAAWNRLMTVNIVITTSLQWGPSISVSWRMLSLEHNYLSAFLNVLNIVTPAGFRPVQRKA